MSKHVLVINAGSSSLKYSLVDADRGEAAGSGLVERIGEANARLLHRGPEGPVEAVQEVRTHEDALRLALEAFENHGPRLDSVEVAAVGHRAVHGGNRFSAPVLVDDDLVETVEQLIPLAPLHNPANLEGMKVARRIFPDLPHVAVFDTAFHQTLPPAAYTYAVPREWSEQHLIRRYGFHGTSVQFVVGGAARLLGRPMEELKLIVLHLGNGASATAVDRGRSVDTSMGFTPLEGLVMGTRSGDIDPAIPGHLARNLGWSALDVDHVLNREAGMKGLVGHNDFREINRMRDAGDPAAALAMDVYCHRLRKYVGAYFAVLNGADAIVFTGGIGENDEVVRGLSMRGLDALGIEIDESLNDVRSKEPRNIASASSRVAVLVIPTNEEWEIARQALAVAEASGG